MTSIHTGGTYDIVDLRNVIKENRGSEEKTYLFV